MLEFPSGSSAMLNPAMLQQETFEEYALHAEMYGNQSNRAGTTKGDHVFLRWQILGL